MRRQRLLSARTFAPQPLFRFPTVLVHSIQFGASPPAAMQIRIPFDPETCDALGGTDILSLVTNCCQRTRGQPMHDGIKWLLGESEARHE